MPRNVSRNIPGRSRGCCDAGEPGKARRNGHGLLTRMKATWSAGPLAGPPSWSQESKTKKATVVGVGPRLVVWLAMIDEEDRTGLQGPRPDQRPTPWRAASGSGAAQ